MQLAEKIGVSDKTIGMGQAVLMQLLNIFGNIYYSLTFRNHRNAIHENYIHFLVVFLHPFSIQHFSTIVIPDWK